MGEVGQRRSLGAATQEAAATARPSTSMHLDGNIRLAADCAGTALAGSFACLQCAFSGDVVLFNRRFKLGHPGAFVREML